MVFLGGRMEGELQGRVEVLVNGAPSGEPVTAVRPAPEAPAVLVDIARARPADCAGLR